MKAEGDGYLKVLKNLSLEKKNKSLKKLIIN